jgi:hypothetical protein
MAVVPAVFNLSVFGGKFYPSNYLVRTLVLRQSVQTSPDASSATRSNDNSLARSGCRPQEDHQRIEPHGAKAPVDPLDEWSGAVGAQ